MSNRVEVLIATMHQKDYSIIEGINVQSDAVIANQTDNYSSVFLKKDNCNIRFINTSLRGSSKNRNLLLSYAKAEYILFCDTDERLVDGYSKIIEKAFEELPDADIIAFEVDEVNCPKESVGQNRGRKPIKAPKKSSWFRYYGTVRIACRRKSISSHSIAFNECFGAGTMYSQADDSLFIRLARKNRLKIYEYPAVIATVDCSYSTHFEGYTKKYFYDKGAFCQAAFPFIKYVCGAALLRRIKGSTSLSLRDRARAILDGMNGFLQKKSFGEYYRMRENEKKIILVAGATGFLGKNLLERLNKNDRYIVRIIPKEFSEQCIIRLTKDCDFVFDFASVHRPLDEEEFNTVNHLYLVRILDALKKNNNPCPVIYTSSIQSGNGTPYGESKRNAENALVKHFNEMEGDVKPIIYRLTNTFGRYARPNSHSVVATFCYNISHGLPIRIDDENTMMNFYYIDDVVDAFISKIEGGDVPKIDGFYYLSDVYKYSISIGELAKLLYRFYEEERCGHIIVNNEFERKMADTYLSYKEYKI